MRDGLLKIAGICRAHGVALSPAQEDALQRYVDLLLEWNAKINLISRRDEGNVWVSHILHSLAPLFVLEIPDGAHVLDLGTGGGLPGVPMAIARKDLTFVLLDSIRKKTVALDAIVRELGLTNVTVKTGRVEDSSRDMAGSFDIVFARAVAPLVDLVRWAKPLVRRGSGATAGSPGMGGRFGMPFLAAFKGGDVSGEVALAGTRTGEKRITPVDLVFRGSAEPGLEEKKLIIVEF